MNQQPKENEPLEKTASDSFKYKIFPRNLTARADYIVTGNPTNSRPEAGVDNCYPGLEFDQRNLDQRFFPGLVFYYHRSDGARLIELALTELQKTSGLTEEDIVSPPLYLWGMLARHLVQESQPSMLSFQGQSGMEVWRRVHDLLLGTVAIVFGPTPGLAANLTDELQAALTKAYGLAAKGEQLADQFSVVRGKDGKVAYGVFADQRSPYLDGYGVIDPRAYPPGDLTKTMCAPWMYDFRDCYCFYWSSNKPDIVKVVHDGELQPYVNFLRRVEDRQGPPKADVDYYWKIVDEKKIQRRDLELTYENMVEGWWQKLPVVLNDTENTNALASPSRHFSAAAEQLGGDDIITELTYLATVEHALTVEYLYAYYSINADRAAAVGDNSSSRIGAAASQVFQIAVDEMRHLMWANLSLRLLGAPASVGRAERIAEPPDRERNGRRPLFDVAIKYLDQPFALNPLNHATLDWFIQVEAPSKVINQGLDGMYVYILEALEMRRREIPNADRIIPVIKLIVDEGEGHWERFERIKETLDGIPEERYLRALSNEPPNAEQTEYLQVCDAYYHMLIKSIELSLSLGEIAQAQLVGAAVRMMKSLDEMAFVLARQGYLPRFTLTKKAVRPARIGALRLGASREFDLRIAGGVLASNTPMSELESTYGRLDRSLQALRETGSPEARLRIARHRHRLAEHILDVDAIIMHDLQTRVGQR
jgi:Ferritin-like